MANTNKPADNVFTLVDLCASLNLSNFRKAVIKGDSFMKIGRGPLMQNSILVKLTGDLARMSDADLKGVASRIGVYCDYVDACVKSVEVVNPETGAIETQNVSYDGRYFYTAFLAEESTSLF